MVKSSGSRGSPGAGFWTYRRFPPILNDSQQAQLKDSVQAPPQEAGIELSNWNWKVIREFIKQNFGYQLCRSSCLNYLYRLGFMLKRPRKRLLMSTKRIGKPSLPSMRLCGLKLKSVRPRSSLLMKPIFGRMPTWEASGGWEENWLWLIRPVLVWGRKPLTIREYVWKRGR